MSEEHDKLVELRRATNNAELSWEENGDTIEWLLDVIDARNAEIRRLRNAVGHVLRYSNLSDRAKARLKNAMEEEN